MYVQACGKVDLTINLRGVKLVQMPKKYSNILIEFKKANRS